MQLAKFVEWAIKESAFLGCDLDGGSVQDEALKAGVIVETKYDPAVHGTSETTEYVVPGDRWFVFSDEFKTALNREE